MKSEIKNYARYFAHRHLKYIILEFVVLFLLLPFQLYTSIFGKQTTMMVEVIEAQFIGLMIFSIILLSIITPLLLYRFMFKRKQCDVYFALPIKRKKLFDVQYIIGVLLALIPFTINVILAFCVLCNEVANLNEMFVYTLLLYILFFALYSMITFIISKCNTLLDAIIMTLALVFLPFILYIAVQNFLMSQINQIFVSTRSSVNEFMNIDTIFNFISPLKCSFYYQSERIMRYDWKLMSITIPMVYWSVIGCIAVFFARKTFINRNEEDSEQKTTSIVTYPLLMLLTTSTLIITTFPKDYLGIDMIINIVMVFVFFAILTFIRDRKIKIKRNEIVFFAIIYCITICFTFAFQSTKGFSLLDEVPSLQNVKEVTLNIWQKAEDEEFSNEYDSYGNHYESSDRTISNKDSIKNVISTQKKLVEIGKWNEHQLFNTDESSITFTYILKNGNRISRSYEIFNSKGEDILSDLSDIIY